MKEELNKLRQQLNELQSRFDAFAARVDALPLIIGGQYIIKSKEGKVENNFEIGDVVTLIEANPGDDYADFSKQVPMIESRKKPTPEKEDFLTLRLSRHQRKQIDQLKEETGLFKSRSHLVRTLLTEGLEVMTDRFNGSINQYVSLCDIEYYIP